MHLKVRNIFYCLVLLSFQASSLEWQACRIGADNSPKIKAHCTQFKVPENRENPSRMIELNMAMIKSSSAKKESDPVLMLAGGPGQAAVESYQGIAHAFKKILKNRDVILVDQRGTGGSNILKCDFSQELQEQMLTDPSIITEEIKKCNDNLDADSRYYTTTESIKDLEAVRKALNIEQWNLLGISYGTRKALTYVKMFPDSIRSIILDGVVPQQEPLAQSHEKNLVNALRKQFEQCQKQPACAEAFGDVEQQMWQLLEKVENDKPTIRLQNFTTGEYESITLTKDMIAMAIRLFAYTPETMSLLPLMISKANDGQLETVAAQASMIANAMSGSLSNVELSIICGEDLPFYKDFKVSEKNVFGNFIKQTQDSCGVWPHLNVDPSFKAPVNSDLPFLLLSGELDPVTPPEFAEITMQTLSNAQHLVAKGQGHNVFPRGCLPKVISTFIEDPNQELDTTCMNDFDYTPFFINMMGPQQ